ncbi:solute carrier family 46 member 3-like [Mizuhopecten yessoensis]|uniref:Solute carrier family 46 member 3 n=1 Tax=Mizuhopecten yessoensis TaxID=6573 RepID=A0A210QE36_MIZYE|nr:solute carrier family 46 member 3-like [Mizuhopecten yessoensis]XP_021360417.1 solute carrier family 46 member 3-like [Mizuhopecten yessoensis]OWF47005.1 Solute carrier family 46 member 3 [Mizuhopecten yessoensis]
MADDREPLLASSSECGGYGSTTDGVKGLDLEEQSDVPGDKNKMDLKSLVVLPIIFLYMFSFITAFANVSQYGYYSIGKSMYPNQSNWDNVSSNQCEANQSQLYKEQTRVQEATSLFNIYLSLAGGIPAIFANLIFGTFSDKFGRKFLFILPAIGSFLRCVIVLIVMYLEADVYFLLIAFFIEGTLGYFLGIAQAGYAYMADITAANDKRSFAITLVEVSLGLGSFLGFLVSGYLIKSIGFTWTTVFSAGLLVVCLIMIMLLLPESVTSAQITERRKCSDVIKYVGNALAFYFKRSSDRERWKYVVCISVFFLTTLTLLGRPSVETLLQLGSPFCWDPVEIGYYGTVRSGVQQVICLLLVKLLQYCMRDEAIAIVGALSSTASLVMEGFVTTETSFYIVPVVGAGGVLTMPMVRAIMSKMTPADKQGTMFAGAAAFETIGTMVSSVIANAIYNATVTILQGMVFFVMATFSFVSCLLLMLLLIIPQCGVKKTRSVQHDILTV